MVKLRLVRMGTTKKPQYRIVAIEHARAAQGKYIESLGNYSPRSADAQVKLDEARVQHYLNNGAQLSETVRALLKKQGFKVPAGR